MVTPSQVAKLPDGSFDLFPLMWSVESWREVVVNKEGAGSAAEACLLTGGKASETAKKRGRPSNAAKVCHTRTRTHAHTHTHARTHAHTSTHTHTHAHTSTHTDSRV